MNAFLERKAALDSVSPQAVSCILLYPPTSKRMADGLRRVQAWVSIQQGRGSTCCTYLDDDVRYTIPHIGSCSWVTLFHTHRKLHVRLLGGVALTVRALSQRLGDDKERNVHPVLEKLGDDLHNIRNGLCCGSGRVYRHSST